MAATGCGDDAGAEAWTDVLADADLAEGQLVRVAAAGSPVVVTRRHGVVRALGAVCSHAGAPLEQGELDDQDCLVCPWHASRFRLSDGSVAAGPAASPQPSYDVRLRDGRLHLRTRS